MQGLLKIKRRRGSTSDEYVCTGVSVSVSRRYLEMLALCVGLELEVF